MKGKRKNGKREYESCNVNHASESKSVHGIPLTCASATKDGNHSAEPEDSNGEFSHQPQCLGVFHFTRAV